MAIRAPLPAIDIVQYLFVSLYLLASIAIQQVYVLQGGPKKLGHKFRQILTDIHN